LDSQWNALKSASEIKRKCLDDSHKCVTFTRLCDDLSAWCDECEQQLATDDNGHDLSSCKTLLVRHDNLTKQITAQQAKLDELTAYLASNQSNFMITKMQSAADAVSQRYQSLHEPCQIRRENLDESLILFNMLNELEDFDQWAQEKLTILLDKTDSISISSLDEIRNCSKQHEQLVIELSNQNQLLLVAFKTTRQLIERKHFAHIQLAQRVSELEEKWSKLQAAVEKRTQLLQDSMAVQQFYSDCDELLTWLKSKEIDLTSSDYGKNDAAAMSLLKKLQSLMNDLKTNQKVKYGQLIAQSQLLQGFSDVKSINRKLAECESQISRLMSAGVEREHHLNAMLNVFEFERECEQTIVWLKDQEVVAASQDFGTDLEHAETLLKKFNEFMQHDLEKHKDRITRIDYMAQQLCENKYTPSNLIDGIDERCSSLNQLWRDLSTLAEVRRQTLEGAIEVHAFDKDCDDLITWASEKAAFLQQQQEEFADLDMASVHTLCKQQDSLEQELTALSEELERLIAESARLCTQYPETKEHIETRLEDADSIYNDLLRKLNERKDRLESSQAMFALNAECIELNEWLRDMLTKITSNDTQQQQQLSAELLIKRHKEFKSEIDTQQVKVAKFVAKSKELCETKLSGEDVADVNAKIETVTTGMRNLQETWHARADLYEQNLEYNKLLREIKLLDAWLSAQDAVAHTDVLGDSVSAVEALIKQHADFESTLNAMRSRFDLLSRESKLEVAMRELREREAVSKQKADAQIELEKKKEAERKKRLEQRRMDDRRRTQEIVANIQQTQQQQPTTVSIPIEYNDSTGEINSLSQVMTPKASNEPVQQTQPQVAVSSQAPSNAVRNKKDRNRTRSIREKYKLPLTLPQPTVRAYLARKQEFQKGGQRAPIREYQTFYTTIHANLMCFFVDLRDYNQLNAACQPINLYKCKLNRLEDTTLQRDVIHLETADGAEYLFDAAGDNEDDELFAMWLGRINEASGN
jgi:spectrin beta